LLSVLPGLAFGAALSAFPVDTPLLQADSSTYIAFAPHRTAGYPMFLEAVTALLNGLGPVVYVQLWIFSLALAALGLALFRLTGCALLSVAVSLGVLLVPELRAFHFVILTESLFLSLTLLILAQLAALARGASLGRLAVLSGLTGVAVALRPVGYSFVPLIALGLVFQWQAWRGRAPRALLAAVLPLALAVGAEYFAYHLRHGPDRQSLAGSHLFAKAGLADAGADARGAAPGALGELSDRLEHDLGDLRRFLAESPGFAVRSHLMVNYESFLQTGFAVDARRRASRESGRPEDALLTEVALARLRRAPLDYLRLTLDHYRALWTIRKETHPDTARRTAAYLESNRPIPFEAEMGYLRRAAEPNPRARLERALILAVGAATFAVAVLSLVTLAARGRVAGAFGVAALSAMMVHGNFLLIGMTALGLPRYTMAMWPAMAVALALTAWAILDRYGPRGLVDRLRRC
jgi:hypothetical protein